MSDSYNLPPEAEDALRQALQNGLAMFIAPDENGGLHLGFIDAEPIAELASEEPGEDGHHDHLAFVTHLEGVTMGEKPMSGYVQAITSLWGIVSEAFIEAEEELEGTASTEAAPEPAPELSAGEKFDLVGDSGDLVLRLGTPEAARHFKHWLSGQGEQYYWDWMSCRESEEGGDITALRFDYWTGDNVVVGAMGRLDD